MDRLVKQAFYLRRDRRMLAFSLAENKEIVISTTQGTISVSIIEIRCEHVTIGIELPATVPIHRGEISAPDNDCGED